MKIKILQRPADLRQLPHMCILSEPGGKFNMKMRFVGATLSVTAFRRDSSPKGRAKIVKKGLCPGKFPFTCCMPVPDAHCPVEAQEAAGQGFVLHPDGAPAVNETFHFKDGESSEEAPRQNRPRNIFRTIREKGEFDLFFTWVVFRILHGGDKMGA